MLKYFPGSTSDYSSMSPEELSHSSREGLLNTSKEDSTTSSTSSNSSSSPSSGKCEEEEKEETSRAARNSRRHSWAGGSPPGVSVPKQTSLHDFKAQLAVKKIPAPPTPPTPAVELPVSTEEASQVFGSSYRKKVGGWREHGTGFSVIQEEKEIEGSKENLVESEE